jgi:hypothetical protein
MPECVAPHTRIASKTFRQSGAHRQRGDCETTTCTHSEAVSSADIVTEVDVGYRWDSGVQEIKISKQRQILGYRASQQVVFQVPVTAVVMMMMMAMISDGGGSQAASSWCHAQCDAYKCFKYTMATMLGWMVPESWL